MLRVFGWDVRIGLGDEGKLENGMEIEVIFY